MSLPPPLCAVTLGTNPYSAISESTLHSAFTKCLDLERFPPHNEEIQPMVKPINLALMLGFMMTKAPSRQGAEYIATKIVEHCDDGGDLVSLGLSYRKGILDALAYAPEDAYLVDVRNKEVRIKEAIKLWGDICPLSGLLDVQCASVEQRLTLPRIVGCIRRARILPVIEDAFIDEENIKLGKMYEFLRHYAQIDATGRDGLSSPLNMIQLEEELLEFYRSLGLWFEIDQGKENQYLVKCESSDAKEMVSSEIRERARVILPLPGHRFMEMQRSIAEVTNMSFIQPNDSPDFSFEKYFPREPDVVDVT